jgi:hypothetical protein
VSRIKIDTIKNYIKNNKLYIMIMLIGILAFAFQLKYVVLYADDFSSKIHNVSNWLAEIFQRCKTYYMNWRRNNMFLDLIFRDV